MSSHRKFGSIDSHRDNKKIIHIKVVFTSLVERPFLLSNGSARKSNGAVYIYIFGYKFLVQRKNCKIT